MNEIPTEVQVKLRETETLAASYEHYVVDTPEKYVASADDLKQIKAKAKELTATKMSLTRPIEESKKRIIALFAKPIGFLEAAESSVKRAMVAWQAKLELARREEQKRLDEIQRKEAEKLRIAAEKEEARIANLKTDAAKARATEKAEQLKTQAEVVTAIPTHVESKVEEVAGISTRKAWKFEVVDAMLLPREYLIPDEKYIGQIVRASQGKKEIPGVRIWAEDIISARVSTF